MGDFFKKKWVEIIINALVSALIVLLGFALTSKKADSQDLIKKVEQKADIEYVDKQDNTIVVKINDHIAADDKKDQMTTKWMESIDRKLDILISKEKK